MFFGDICDSIWVNNKFKLELPIFIMNINANMKEYRNYIKTHENMQKKMNFFKTRSWLFGT